MHEIIIVTMKIMENGDYTRNMLNGARNRQVKKYIYVHIIFMRREGCIMRPVCNDKENKLNSWSNSCLPLIRTMAG